MLLFCLQYTYDFSFLQISMENVKAIKARGEDYMPLFGMNVSFLLFYGYSGNH